MPNCFPKSLLRYVLSAAMPKQPWWSIFSPAHSITRFRCSSNSPACESGIFTLTSYADVWLEELKLRLMGRSWGKGDSNSGWGRMVSQHSLCVRIKLSQGAVRSSSWSIHARVWVPSEAIRQKGCTHHMVFALESFKDLFQTLLLGRSSFQIFVSGPLNRYLKL